MHIAVDAMGIKHSGGATVLLDFLNAAVIDDRISRISIFCSPRAKRNFDLAKLPKVREYEQSAAENSYLLRILWFEKQLGKQCRQIDAAALLCLVGAGKASPSLHHVTFVQQSLPFLEGYRKTLRTKDQVRLLVLERLMSRSCKSAAAIIVQTPTMKTDLSQRFGIPPGRIKVAMPNAGSISRQTTQPTTTRFLSGPGPNLLFVGNDAAYKNVDVVFRSMVQLRSVFPEATLCVTWPKDHPAAQYEGVQCLGYLSKPALAQSYREATCLVMPSLIETVGLPMLEAMSIGLPVLAADRPYAHDVCENAALFFDPLSTADFVRTASALLGNDALQLILMARGKALMQRREQETPYLKMLDAVVAAAGKRQQGPWL
jgi:glycosyltransferase involved in cell wall biosynthesis